MTVPLCFCIRLGLAWKGGLKIPLPNILVFPKSKNPCLFFAKITITFSLGSGWCSVGRVVAFDIRSKSNYRKTFILNVCLLSTVLKSPYWKNLVGDVKTKCSPIISNYFKQFLLHRYVYQNSPKIQQTLGNLCKKFVTKNCKKYQSGHTESDDKLVTDNATEAPLPAFAIIFISKLFWKMFGH